MNNNAAIVEIAQTASKFSSSIVLQAENKYIDVKSILGLFTTLLRDHEYELHVHGTDAQEAISELTKVFEKYNINIKVVK